MTPTAFERTPQVEHIDHGKVIEKRGSSLRVRYGVSTVAATCASSLAAQDVAIGDTVLLQWLRDVAYAIAKIGASSVSALNTTTITSIVSETTPQSHSHEHDQLVGLGDDDHPQYLLVPTVTRGQLLICADGSLLESVLPLTSHEGGWLIDDDGYLLIAG